MNDIADVWNERLRSSRKEKKLSQTAVAQMMRKEDIETQQKSVSNWENVGNVGKNGIPLGFPKMENILQLSKIYGKDVGYFLGETDHETFSAEKACEHFCFDIDTGKKLHTILSNECNDNFINSTIAENRRKAFSLLVNSNYFEDVLDSIYALYEAYTPKYDVYKHLKSKYTKKELLKGYDYIGYPSEVLENMDIDEKTAEVIRDLNSELDNAYIDDEKRITRIEIEEYRMQKTLLKLIDAMKSLDNQPLESPFTDNESENPK